LEGEADFTVKVLVQAVVAAGFVVQDQRRGFGLPGLVADFQEGGVVWRIGRARFAEDLRPLVSDFRQVRIGAHSEAGHGLRERVGEVFVVADAEAVALHDDLATEAGFILIERDDGGAFGGRENWSRDRVATGGERFPGVVPVECVDAFLNGRYFSSWCDLILGSEMEPRRYGRRAQRIYPALAFK
jgi:hypothetical protein